MKTEEYKLIEGYMLECMSDSAHDKDHIYRVLYMALDIAGYEKDVNYSVLIAACLLHDIGRQEQFDDPQLCHATVGAVKAQKFLVKSGFDIDFANKVALCIRAHRFRSENPPTEIEEQILFDADRLISKQGNGNPAVYGAKIRVQQAETDYKGYGSDGICNGDGDDRGVRGGRV